MCIQRLSKICVLCLVFIVFTACSVTLQHKALISPSAAVTGTMAVAANAENMKSRIGSGTFTVFAIPVAKVTVQGEASRELMVQIKDAVAQMGYEPKVVEKTEDAAGAPILACNVQRFKFKNYTWFFPIVFNWGKIILDVSVTKDGNSLWTKTYTAKGNGTYSFNTPVKKALTRILNEMIKDMTSADFQSKVWGK